ncbi:reverse transcriptase domain-containing protein [Tanacetum coccineum]
MWSLRPPEADWAIVSPHFSTNILSRIMPDYFSNGHMYPLPWIAVEKVYLLVNEPKKHWCLAELEIRNGVITFYDSLGWADGSRRRCTGISADDYKSHTSMPLLLFKHRYLATVGYGFQWVSDDELEAPKEAPQSPEQAPPLSDYVPSPEHLPSPDYVPGREEPDQAPLSPEYVPEPVHLEYLALSDDDILVKYQPLPADASSTALSPCYIADSDLEEDPEDDPEEDHADYPANRGDEEEEESFKDGADDKDKEEAYKEEDDDEEEEEHLALADSSGVPIDDHVPSAEDTEAIETDESAPILTSPRPRRARIYVRLEPPMAASMEARIVEYAIAPTPPSPLPSPLSPLSSPLSQIPSPPLPLPSPPLPLPTPSSPLLLLATDRREDIPKGPTAVLEEVMMTAPTPRIEIEEALQRCLIPPMQRAPSTRRTLLKNDPEVDPSELTKKMKHDK